MLALVIVRMRGKTAQKEHPRVWQGQMRLEFVARASALETVSYHPIAEGCHGLCHTVLEQQAEAFSV